MKVCFMFPNLNVAEQVEQFLSQSFNVSKTSYLGYVTLYVPVEKYQEAIIAGLEMITSHNIQTGWLVDCNGKRVSLNSIPLLYAKIPRFFKLTSFRRRIARWLCDKYAKNFSKRLGVNVTLYYVHNFNVEFHIARSYHITKNYESYVENIIAYCMSHWHFFNYITVCNAYGNAIANINRNHSVQ